MIKKNKTIFFILIVVFVANTTMAQKGKLITEGRVIYDISIDGDLNPIMAAMMPTEMTLYLKKEKLRTELSGTGWSNVIIADTKAHTSVALIDMMGNKKARKISPDEIGKNYTEHKPNIVELKETKEIAGFKCTKAEITDSKGEKSYVYFTKAVTARNGSNLNLRDIDGFLMEYQTNQNGIKLKLTARSINGAYKVEDSLFSIPEGYTEITKDDLKKLGN